jgi:aspartokinase-like uncharacterized kinase
MSGALTVVKVGGSLYDQPDLGPRLRNWLNELAAPHVLLVPGGGPTADIVREFDRIHHLGEEQSHWLALQALTLNASFLTGLLPGGMVVADWRECFADEARGRGPVLDCHAFLRADEGRPGCLPHAWTVTSDSVAARVAAVSGAEALILLKSTAVSADLGWDEAARRGWVDAYFPHALPAGLRVRAINFRACRAGDKQFQN